MGLAASQARYIFITQRKISLEGALMANSNKQIRLAEESTALSEEKQDALNQKQWEFKGSSDFNYDMLMGDTAMTSDEDPYLVMTNGANGKVVLNGKYASAMQMAGVAQTGGQYSDAGLANFMAVAAGSPKEAASWMEVINNPEVQSQNAALQSIKDAKASAADFVDKYGTTIPEAGTHSEITSEQKQFTLNGIISGMGKSATTGKSYADMLSGDTNNADSVVCLWMGDEFNVNSADTAEKNLDKYVNEILRDLSKSLGTDFEILQAQVKGLCDSIKDTFTQHDNMRDSSWGDSVRYARASLVHCGDQHNNPWEGMYNNDSNYYLGDYSSMRNNWGGKKAININLSELVRRIISVVTNAGNIKNSSMYVSKNTDLDKWYSDNKQYFTQHGNSNTIDYNVQHKKDVENEVDGITYNSWMNAYNALSNAAKHFVYEGLSEETQSQIRNKGEEITVPEVTSYKQDTATLNKYKQIYTEALNGWVADGNVNNQSYLTNKLANNQYLVKHSGKTSTIKQSEDFDLVSKFDKDEIEAYYDTENKKLQAKDKKLQAEQDRIQMELTAVNSEQESVKTLIQNNIEKGFTYGYNA